VYHLHKDDISEVQTRRRRGEDAWSGVQLHARPDTHLWSVCR
jgi:hypothetical protein